MQAGWQILTGKATGKNLVAHALRRLRACHHIHLFFGGSLTLFGWCGLRRRITFKRRADTALDHSVANSDEFDNRADASIAKAGFGQPEYTRVAAGTIGKSRSNLVEEDGYCLL